MDKYTKVKSLGKGSFGTAILVRRKSDGQLLVAKEVNMTRMNPREKEEARNEVKILEQLKHPNIVQFIEYIERRSSFFIIMEYADGGDLHQKIKNQRHTKMKEDTILHYFSQLCLAMQYLHNNHILHRDIKTMNVFLTSNGMVKLGDFGISTVLRNTMALAKTVCGTPYYFSPELCRNKPYNNKSDVWALGCVLYELCTLNHAFDASSMQMLMQKILKGSYPPISQQYSTGLRQLVADMLNKDPNKRPTISKALQNDVMKCSLMKLQEDLANATLRNVKLQNVVQERNEDAEVRKKKLAKQEAAPSAGNKPQPVNPPAAAFVAQREAQEAALQQKMMQDKLKEVDKFIVELGGRPKPKNAMERARELQIAREKQVVEDKKNRDEKARVAEHARQAAEARVKDLRKGLARAANAVGRQGPPRPVINPHPIYGVKQQQNEVLFRQGPPGNQPKPAGAAPQRVGEKAAGGKYPASAAVPRGAPQPIQAGGDRQLGQGRLRSMPNIMVEKDARQQQQQQGARRESHNLPAAPPVKPTRPVDEHDMQNKGARDKIQQVHKAQNWVQRENDRKKEAMMKRREEERRSVEDIDQNVKYGRRAGKPVPSAGRQVHAAGPVGVRKPSGNVMAPPMENPGVVRPPPAFDHELDKWLEQERRREREMKNPYHRYDNRPVGVRQSLDEAIKMFEVQQQKLKSGDTGPVQKKTQDDAVLPPLSSREEPRRRSASVIPSPMKVKDAFVTDVAEEQRLRPPFGGRHERTHSNDEGYRKQLALMDHEEEQGHEKPQEVDVADLPAMRMEDAEASQLWARRGLNRGNPSRENAPPLDVESVGDGSSRRPAVNGGRDPAQFSAPVQPVLGDGGTYIAVQNTSNLVSPARELNAQSHFQRIETPVEEGRMEGEDSEPDEEECVHKGGSDKDRQGEYVEMREHVLSALTLGVHRHHEGEQAGEEEDGSDDEDDDFGDEDVIAPIVPEDVGGSPNLEPGGRVRPTSKSPAMRPLDEEEEGSDATMEDRGSSGERSNGQDRPRSNFRLQDVAGDDFTGSAIILEGERLFEEAGGAAQVETGETGIVARAEMLRQMLEEQLGMDVLLKAYRLLDSVDSETNTDVVAEIESVVPVDKHKLIPLVAQLIFCDEEANSH